MKMGVLGIRDISGAGVEVCVSFSLTSSGYERYSFLSEISFKIVNDSCADFYERDLNYLVAL